VAKQCKAAFFCKSSRGTLVSWRIFQFRLDLTDTTLIPFGQWQNTIGMFLVNLANPIGMLLVNLSAYENFAKSMSRCLIIYKSYATCFPSGARETQWLSHH
jgi:hypothetical protein